MREHPWNIRRITHQHEHWYQNLVDLQSLTAAWLQEIPADKAPGLTLPWLKPDGLNGLLDETRPEELLQRLEDELWNDHAAVLGTKENIPQLEIASRKAGQECASRRWKNVDPQSARDLRFLLLAAGDHPLSGYPNRRTYLIRRALPAELDLELFFCPHQSPHDNVVASADDLCRLHSQWLQGYLETLNPKVRIEHRIPPDGGRCRQRWFL